MKMKILLSFLLLITGCNAFLGFGKKLEIKIEKMDNDFVDEKDSKTEEDQKEYTKNTNS
jgi:hypothetical protein